MLSTNILLLNFNFTFVIFNCNINIFTFYIGNHFKSRHYTMSCRNLGILGKPGVGGPVGVWFRKSKNKKENAQR